MERVDLAGSDEIALWMEAEKMQDEVFAFPHQAAAALAGKRQCGQSLRAGWRFIDHLPLTGPQSLIVAEAA